MKKLNRQHVLDEVYRHFITQGQPAGTNADGNACYHSDRNGQDCPCAIGLFDPDMYLARAQEQGFPQGIRHLIDDDPYLITRVFDVDTYGETDVQFLQHVQSAHDQSVNSADFKQTLIDELGDVADTFKLVNPHAVAA